MEGEGSEKRSKSRTESIETALRVERGRDIKQRNTQAIVRKGEKSGEW